MTSLTSRAALLLGAACLIAAAPATTAKVADILAAPASFDGKHLAVTGTVQDPNPRTSARGNDYETFQLCDGQCIRVFTFGHPNIKEGQSLTVTGTFAASKHVGSVTYTNELDADEGSLH